VKQSPVKHRNKAEWPSAEANKVLGDAIMVGHDSAVRTVGIIRDELFGNASKMEDLAHAWGRDKTMTSSKDEIDKALRNMSAYWQGGGFTAFRGYSKDISGYMDENEGIMNRISGIMGDCIELVYDTYANALELIAKCAHSLTSLSIADLVPGAGQILKIMDVLNDFVKAWSELFAASVRQMGQLMNKKTTLETLAGDFRGLTAPGSDDTAQHLPPGAANPDMWEVTPTRKDGAT
jgi:hypothetical protein